MLRYDTIIFAKDVSIIFLYVLKRSDDKYDVHVSTFDDFLEVPKRNPRSIGIHQQSLINIFGDNLNPQNTITYS